jgi:D-galactonate transporter
MSDTAKAGYCRFIILALITMLLALSSGDRATLSIAGPGMVSELGISPIGLGWLFSAFAWAYVIAHIPTGWLVDKIGAKWAVLGGVVLWSITTVAMGSAAWFASPFLALMVLRVLLGTFEAPVGPAAGRVIAAWFPSSERGIAGAIFNSAQYVSLVLFTPLMGWLAHSYGWQSVYVVMGALGLAFAIAWGLLYFAPMHHPLLKQPELEYMRAGGALVDLAAETTEAPKKHGPSLADFGQLFRSRIIVGVLIAQYCINSITWFFVSWFPTYLVKARGLSILDASLIAALPALSGFVGGVATGFVSDWILRRSGNLSMARKIPITIGLVMSALMIGCNYTDSSVLIVFLMSAAFFGKGFGSLGWTVIADVAPKELIGVTGGLINGLGNTAGIVTPLVIGYILSATGSFNGALTYVGLHGLVAILSYWVIVGRIERIDMRRVRAPAGVPVTP